MSQPVYQRWSQERRAQRVGQAFQPVTTLRGYRCCRRCGCRGIGDSLWRDPTGRIVSGIDYTRGCFGYEGCLDHRGRFPDGRHHLDPRCLVERAFFLVRRVGRNELADEVCRHGIGIGVVEDQGYGQSQAGGLAEPVAKFHGGQGVQTDVGEWVCGIYCFGRGMIEHFGDVGAHFGQERGVLFGR